MKKLITVVTILVLSLKVSPISCKSWIIFYADNSSASGHAFVSFVKEDDKLQQTIVVGCWGFYPKNGLGAFGEVEGKIKNDIARQKDIGLMIEVCEKEFSRCLQVKQEWETKNYSLFHNNCVYFIDDIARQIPNLIRPSTKSLLTAKFPIDYVSELKIFNAKYVVECPVDNCTLFLIDVSGSMAENNKIGEAVFATSSAIKNTRQEAQQSGKSPEIGIMVFSGDCIANPTTLIQPFSTDLNECLVLKKLYTTPTV